MTFPFKLDRRQTQLDRKDSASGIKATNAAAAMLATTTKSDPFADMEPAASAAREEMVARLSFYRRSSRLPPGGC